MRLSDPLKLAIQAATETRTIIETAERDRICDIIARQGLQLGTRVTYRDTLWPREIQKERLEQATRTCANLLLQIRLESQS